MPVGIAPSSGRRGSASPRIRRCRRFTVTTFDDADQVLRDWRSFSASINGEVMRPYMGELMLGLDGDEHRRYRNLVAYAFRRSTLERWRGELVEPVIETLLDAIAPWPGGPTWWPRSPASSRCR